MSASGVEAVALERVAAAAACLAEAEITLMVEVQRAHEGVSKPTITALAEAARVTRPTIYAWLRSERALPPRSEWAELLLEALRMLAGRGSEAAAGALIASQPSLAVYARRLEQGVAQLQPADQVRPGTADWDVLARARDVARAVASR